jgi:transcriptional regulator with GAF, ATPase, and Fis domain
MKSAVAKNSKRLLPARSIEDFIRLDQLQSLSRITRDLERQLESLHQSSRATVNRSLDFYLEVQRFEVALIKQALRGSRGCQRRAATLLNPNHTTLNSMIKRYRIPLDLLHD